VFIFSIERIIFWSQIFFALERRTTLNWRHIVSPPKLDYCWVHNLGILIPQYEKLINNSLKTFFPNNSIDCPVKSAKYYSTEIMIFTGELKATDQIPSKKSDTNGFPTANIASHSSSQATEIQTSSSFNGRLKSE
jgi:hypothetical protein